MSTAQALSVVKQALLEKLHQEIVPQLEQLVQALPEQLIDFDQAEVQLRHGLLKVAQHLLEIWGHLADLKVARPYCSKCGVPMRHRGLPETGVGLIPAAHGSALAQVDEGNDGKGRGRRHGC